MSELVKRAEDTLAKCISPTGLVLPDSMRYEEWAAIGQVLRRTSSQVQWAIGDWLLYGEHKFGEMYVQAADMTGYDQGYLRHLTRASKAIPSVMRHHNLGHSYYVAVALTDLSDEDKEELLKAAQNLNRDPFRKLVKEYVQLRAQPDPSADPPNPPEQDDDVPVGAVVDLNTGREVCDGDHAPPACTDPKCWQKEPIEAPGGQVVTADGHVADEAALEEHNEVCVVRNQSGEELVVLPEGSGELLIRVTVLIRASVALRDALEGANENAIKMTQPRRVALANWRKALADCEGGE
jgi:hypothetical protein